MRLYHGTLIDHALLIMDQGLKGGDNSFGGNRGIWEVPLLFMSPDEAVAEKYGVVIEINIPEEFILDFNFEILNDGLGDKCWVLEGDGVLIDKKYLTCEALKQEEKELIDYLESLAKTFEEEMEEYEFYMEEMQE